MAPNSGRPFQPGDPRINRRGPVGKHALGFAQRVREATNQGQDCIEFALKVRDGKVLDEVLNSEGGVVSIMPSVKVRLDAAKWLAERGFGRTVDASDPDEDAFTNRSETELLAELLDALPAEQRRFMWERLKRQMPEAVQ